MKRGFNLVIVFFMLFLTMISAQTGYASTVELQPDTPQNVDMLDQPLHEIDAAIDQSMGEREIPGAVVLVAKDGKIVKHDAYGYAARYLDDEFTEMDQPVPMQKDTIFDVASMSKLFTATAVMQLWDQGKFDLDDPVVNYIPEFAVNAKDDVTIRQLLTHTSGFSPSPQESLYKIDGNRDDRLNYVLEQPLENQPGTAYVYSDVNYLTLGVLIERLSGQREDIFVNENIIKPLEMTDTMYNPPNTIKDRVAATEYQPWTNRGLVWGSVHDENAWALDGIAGQAGIFSSAEDLAVFGQMMLNRGSYQGEEIISEQAFDLVNTNWNEDFPGQDQGLGWELNQDWYMDGLAESNTMGHTGYTGTSIVVSPNKNTIVILLTNRVHPTRDTPSTNPIRKKVSEKTAYAINAWSAANMKKLVEKLEDDNEFENVNVAYTLKLHLTAVNQYEKTESDEKVIKHMESFKRLLDHQLEDDLISEDVYETLKTSADYLIDKWQ